MTRDATHEAWHRSEYELVDFGAGRKLERFGSQLFDRPCPAADSCDKLHPQKWSRVCARYDRDLKKWMPSNAVDRLQSVELESVRHGEVRFQLRLTPAGQIGLFPEQSVNWRWLSNLAAGQESRLKLLNLFAYTGGSTLAAAAAGAEVVHVDASKTVVQWARNNAKLSGLDQCPVRWIQEDTLKFVRREVKRGRRYDGVILDPPSYGHGPKGEVWQIDDALAPLLRLTREVTVTRPAMLLISCHSPGHDAARLADLVAVAFGSALVLDTAGPLWLETHDGRKLNSGNVARFVRAN